MPFHKLIKLVISTFFAIGLFFNSHGQENKSVMVSCIGFYNLENLFDTIIDPDTNKILQDDFTPHGKKQWNSKKYFHKLGQMAKVISEIGTDLTPQGVSILGVAEVENKLVLDDLVKQDAIANRDYRIVHAESPDKRGIDVALLYNPLHFNFLEQKSFALNIPGDSAFSSRSQLLVTGELFNERIHVIVAHWPSRRGGEKRSAPLRCAAASLGKQIADSIYKSEPNAKILYMGDLNDDPTNKSVKDFINAGGKKEKLADKTFYNPMENMYKKGIGTLAWRDVWNLFDQILISPSLVNEQYDELSFYTAKIFNKEYLKQHSGNFKGYPFRSYVGGTYTGGYSDHFPSYVLLVKNASN